MDVHSFVTLSNTVATRLTPSGVHSGINLSVQNVNESGYIYLGGETVSTSSYGFRIAPSSAISFELDGPDAIYAVSETDGLNAAVITLALAEV